jgi:hypothetical protein
MANAGSGGGGPQLLLLLALVAAAAGGGTWNYQRNLALEERAVRPYRSLATPDLELLLAATEAEAGALSNAAEQAGARPVPAGNGSGRFADFEAAQRRGRAVRDLGAQLSGHEGAIAEMRKELTRRSGEGDSTQVLLRRIFTL